MGDESWKGEGAGIRERMVAMGDAGWKGEGAGIRGGCSQRGKTVGQKKVRESGEGGRTGFGSWEEQVAEIMGGLVERG